MYNLEFEIAQQTTKLRFLPVAAGSLKYLTARFCFSSDWDGLTKTVSFVKDNTRIDRVVNSNNELTASDNLQLNKAGTWIVGVTGVNTAGKKITTKPVKIFVSEQLESTGTEPTPAELTLYEQAVAIAGEARTTVNTLSTNIAGYVQTCTTKASDAASSAQNASASASSASGYASSASGYADDASGYANTAKGYRDEAQQAANMSLEKHGIMQFSINSSGHLIYNATDDQSRFTWTLTNGRLMVSYD